MNQLATKKLSFKLSKGEYMRLLFLAKLKRIAARLQNKITERIYSFLVISGSEIELDKSKTKWRIKYGGDLCDCELTYENQLMATATVCPNPCLVDLELLKDEYPEAYRACVSANGRHLRFNLKK